MADDVKSKPVHKARLGPLQLAIWANEYQNDDGEIRIFHTINIERNYRDKDDKWHKTSQLRESDLGEAQALLQNAQQWLIKVSD